MTPDTPSSINGESGQEPLTNDNAATLEQGQQHSQHNLEHPESIPEFIQNNILFILGIINTLTTLNGVAEAIPELVEDGREKPVLEASAFATMVSCLLQDAIIFLELLKKPETAQNIEFIKHKVMEFIERFYFIFVFAVDIYAEESGLTGANSRKEENTYAPAIEMLAGSLFLALVTEPLLWNSIIDKTLGNHPKAANASKYVMVALGSFITEAAKLREIAYALYRTISPETLMSAASRNIRYGSAAIGGSFFALKNVHHAVKDGIQQAHEKLSWLDFSKEMILSASLLMLMSQTLEASAEILDPTILAAMNVMLGTLGLMTAAKVSQNTYRRYQTVTTHQEQQQPKPLTENDPLLPQSASSSSIANSCSTLYYHAKNLWQSCPSLSERFRHTK